MREKVCFMIHFELLVDSKYLSDKMEQIKSEIKAPAIV